MIYYTYAMYDTAKTRFYVGITNDLRRRVQEHHRGKTQTTKRMNDPRLVYFEACLDKKDAATREKQLKTGFGRGYLKRRLKNFLGG